jgi:hypothetical protein
MSVERSVRAKVGGTASRRTVRVSGRTGHGSSVRPARLALLEEIRSAESADDRYAKVIIAVEGCGKLAWRHESVGTLIDLILEHQGEDS